MSPIGNDEDVDEPARECRGELAELAGWVEARLPRLVDDVCAVIIDRIGVYRTDDIVPRDEMYRSVTLNLQFIIAAIADPDPEVDLEVARETGRRRAHQGAPLPEVLLAYRIGFAMVWQELVDHARRTGGPGSQDALLDTASRVWQLTDDHALALTEAYRTATAELLVAQQHRRSALVEALLTGQRGLEGGPWEAGKLLGLPLDAKLVVVAAETRGLAQESLAGIERRFAEHRITSAWRLTPALQVGIVSLRPDQCDTVLDVLREVAGGRTGVSPPYRSLVDTPRAFHLARVAMSGISQGRAEVHMFNPSPLAALVACDPDEGRRLAEQVLGAVLDLPADDRAVLMDTLQAFLAHAGSTDRAAEALHCHPNTVRYRLRRLHELTGRSISDPRTLAELATAMYALQLNHGARAEPWPPDPAR